MRRTASRRCPPVTTPADAMIFGRLAVALGTVYLALVAGRWPAALAFSRPVRLPGALYAPEEAHDARHGRWRDSHGAMPPLIGVGRRARIAFERTGCCRIMVLWQFHISLLSPGCTGRLRPRGNQMLPRWIQRAHGRSVKLSNRDCVVAREFVSSTVGYGRNFLYFSCIVLGRSSSALSLASANRTNVRAKMADACDGAALPLLLGLMMYDKIRR